MNISVLQENLLRALARSGRIVSPKPQLPIMQNVLLVTEESQLRVVTTNMETTEVIYVRAKVEKDGGACVSSRLFLDLVTSLPQDTIQLVAKEGALHVHCRGVNAIIPSAPASEFSPVSVFKKKSGVNIDKKMFLDALMGVLFAAATDEGRPLLTGVKIVGEDGGALFAATDGYRLSMKKIASTTLGKINVIIPARALSEVVKVSQEEKDVVFVEMTQTAEGQLVFGVGDTEIHTRPIAGEYPNIEKIVPARHNTRVLMEKLSLLRAVKSAAVFARDNANVVRLHIENQSVVVSANTPQVGENHVKIEARVDGDGGDIAFNSRFLLEFLNGFAGEDLLFEMTGALNSGVFRPAKDDSYLHIIMPVRTAA